MPEAFGNRLNHKRRSSSPPAIDFRKHFNVRVVAMVAATFLCLTAAGSDNNKTQPSDANLNAVVRDALRHEVQAQTEDKALWCYRKLLEKDGKQQLFAACQTQSAEIDRLMALNGKPLNEKQSRQENQRIERLLNSRSQLRKEKQQQEEDAKQATHLLKMIPEAFNFQQESNDGRWLKVRFAPNPKFRPSSSSESVFHQMEGTLTLDIKQKRLVEISGRLTTEVKFGGGWLGHLDKGGTFFVKQQEVAPGAWEVTTLDVQMNGKALFFKTIAVRTKEIDTDFRRVPSTASIQQAASLTQQVGHFN
jgi:hypothetical protein